MAEDTRSGEAPPMVSGADIRTFLFADMRGYTRFTQEHGDETASALAGRFADLVRDAVPKFEGELLELRGDEALCVFRSARQALRASMELQRRLRTATEDEPAFPLGVGMGLDSGEAVPTEGGYRGGALNLASRLCAVAKSGEVLATEGVVHLARRVDGLRFTATGTRQFKGIDQPVRLVRVVPETPLPPLPAATAPTRRYPTPVKGLVATAVIGVAAAIAIGVILSRSGAGPSVGLPGDAFAVVASDGHASATTAMRTDSSGIAVAGTTAWVPDYPDAEVRRVDTVSGQSQAIAVGAGPDAVAVGYGAVWTANAGDGTVSEVSPTAGKTVGTIYVGNGPSGIAVGQNAVWVALSVDGAVAKINPIGGKVVDTFSAGTDPTRIAFGFGKVWVTNESVGTVTPINTGSDTAETPIGVGGGPNAITVGANAVWVTNSLDGTVSRINPQTQHVVWTAPAGTDPQGVAVVGNTVWVAARGSGQIVRLRATDGRAESPLSVGSNPVDLAALRGGAAVTTATVPTQHRGGRLTIATGPIVPSIDPDSSAAWQLQPWETFAMTNDGLVGFKRVPGPDGQAVVADLAKALPVPTDGGRTYAFQLRQGIRYSTGRPVHASDIQYGLKRTFTAKVGPKDYPLGSIFFDNIVGGPKCATDPRHCDLSPGVRVDDATGTVTFHLRRPDPDFLAKLAMPLAVAVPPQVPRHTSGTHPLPATGPYMITRYQPNQSAVLVRNPYFHEWSRDAQPNGYPDRIVWDVFKNPEQVVTAVEQGAADWLSNQGPPNADRVHELETRYAAQLHPSLFPSTEMLGIPSNSPLNNDPAGRRAIAYAISRQKVVSLLGGHLEAQPTCQLLPPNFPGYRPYCPYTIEPGRNTWTAPNLAVAQWLARHSTTEGKRITVAAGSPASGYVVQLLNSLGYKARLATDPNQAQVGVFSFLDDYPGADDFVGQFQTPLSTADINAALAKQSQDQYQGTLAWAAADRRITNYAQVIPIATDITIGLISKRVGNYEFSPAPGNDPIIDQCGSGDLLRRFTLAATDGAAPDIAV